MIRQVDALWPLAFHHPLSVHIFFAFLTAFMRRLAAQLKTSFLPSSADFKAASSTCIAFMPS
jgi:hypothetical protein